jgi:zinc transport system substrate-binding protein
MTGRISIIRNLLSVLLLVLLFSCAKQPEEKGNKGTVITASFYPVYIMALNITYGVPGVVLEDLTGPQTGCLHDYQLTPADMRKIYSTSLFIINGAGMESFIDKIIRQVPGLEVIDASAGLPLIRDQKTGTVNPHVFVSISGAISQVRTIASRLSVLDPVHADLYSRNSAAYIRKLELL